jgi:hypothetical protein
MSHAAMSEAWAEEMCSDLGVAEHGSGRLDKVAASKKQVSLERRPHPERA